MTNISSKKIEIIPRIINGEHTGSIGVSLLWALLAMIFAVAAVWEARADELDMRPTVNVLPQVKVREERVTLDKIAQIKTTHIDYAPLAQALSKVVIIESIAPKMPQTVPGQRILDAIIESGIPIEAFRYSVPQVVAVEREGREITTDEILSEVKESLAKDSTLNVQVREIRLSNTQIVPIGKASYEIERLGEPTQGKIPLRVSLAVDNAPSARFLATAIVDDWREVPVLTRVIERGMLISPQDVAMVRLNMFQQPADVVAGVDGVLGRRALQRISAGEPLRKALIDIPPMIPKGKQISIIVRSGALQASATGVALEDGHDQTDVRVRNTSSQKILKAKVISSTEVEVDIK